MGVEVGAGQVTPSGAFWNQRGCLGCEYGLPSAVTRTRTQNHTGHIQVPGCILLPPREKGVGACLSSPSSWGQTFTPKPPHQSPLLSLVLRAGSQPSPPTSHQRGLPAREPLSGNRHSCLPAVCRTERHGRKGRGPCCGHRQNAGVGSRKAGPFPFHGV